MRIFNADDIDEREDEPEAQADEDRRQRSGEHDLGKELRRRELEAASDIDQHGPRISQPLDGLEDDRRQRRPRSPS